jgi:hypothetical protein
MGFAADSLSRRSRSATSSTDQVSFKKALAFFISRPTRLRSAMAVLVYNQYFRAFWVPLGGPVDLPPCIRHLLFGYFKGRMRDIPPIIYRYLSQRGGAPEVTAGCQVQIIFSTTDCQEKPKLFQIIQSHSSTHYAPLYRVCPSTAL